MCLILAENVLSNFKADNVLSSAKNLLLLEYPVPKVYDSIVYVYNIVLLLAKVSLVFLSPP